MSPAPRLPSTLALLALVIVSCGARPSELPPTTVLTYGVGGLGGSTSFTVHADGTAEYEHQGYPAAARVRATVTPAELGALFAFMRDNRCCSVSSGRSRGVPDEVRPEYAVRAEGLDCRIQVWNGERHSSARAGACFRAVEELGSKIEARGTPR